MKLHTFFAALAFFAILYCANMGTVSAQYSSLTLDEVLNLAIEDLEDYWDDIFDSYFDEKWQQPSHRILTRSYSGCGPIITSSSFVYCWANHTIYLGADALALQYDLGLGDYAVVTVLAHEVGHAVQAALGINHLSGWTTLQLELMADCFAGSYIKYAAYYSEWYILDESDIAENYNILLRAGIMGNPLTHGTAIDRINALEFGMNNGFESCIEAWF